MTTIKLDPGAALLLDALHGAGHAAYAVGGCVRDSLLGLDPHDWDLCTSARPEQVMALFGEEKCIPTGLQHGTVTVKQGGRLYETTTFRTEGAYSDGRHPDAVCFVPDVREDLARRDFTINAMAYSAEEGLIDPFGGRDDLVAHLVRAVGEPERRFEEDALRILRLYRFAARFGFAIDPATGAAARALGPHLDCVSAERIQEELLKLLAAPRPGSYLEPAVLAVVLPELEPEKQPERFAELCRTIDRIEPTAENVPARLAALLCPLGEAGARKALRKLKCSNALTDEVTALEREAGGGAGSFLLGHESGHSIARPIACGNRVPPQRTLALENSRRLRNFTLFWTYYGAKAQRAVWKGSVSMNQNHRALWSCAMAAALLLTACGKTNAGSGSSGSMSGSSGTSSAQTQTAAWKTGLGVVTEATDQDRAGKIELAAAAVLLDGEGKLESVLLDELEVSVSADSTGHVTLPTDWRTKRQKGVDYPLAEVSSLKKGWAEQADAFANYLIGMSPEQVSMLKVDKDGKPTDADLLSGCTIAVDRYRDAVVRACENAQVLGAARGDTVKLGVEVDEMPQGLVGTDDKDAQVQAKITLAVVTMDENARVTSAIGDMTEPELTVSADGTVSAPREPVYTKNELGDRYGMRSASALGKEWYEHSAGWCSYLKGKNAVEIGKLSADGTDADLKALCTISVTDLQKAVLKAMAEQ